MEFIDVFASHRLKSRWTVETESFWLNEANLEEYFYTTADLEYIDGCRTSTASGPLESWPDGSYTFDSEEDIARAALMRVAHKMPYRCRFVKRRHGL